MTQRPQKTTGQAAEAHVAHWLAQQGLTILQRNYHCQYGEVDIVAQHGESLVFVEVRFRHSASHGTALESVTYAKQQRLVHTALHYLHAYQVSENTRCRFDVVGVYKDTASTWHCQWIQDAFEGA
ncbi:MAG TPA: YraN family protein [Alcanivoracaceae bacterium]|nr:YraN family protein [Alcanivoracaceae bacterium]